MMRFRGHVGKLIGQEMRDAFEDFKTRVENSENRFLGETVSSEDRQNLTPIIDVEKSTHIVEAVDIDGDDVYVDIQILETTDNPLKTLIEVFGEEEIHPVFRAVPEPNGRLIIVTIDVTNEKEIF
jgi:hypothetical protein